MRDDEERLGPFGGLALDAESARIAAAQGRVAGLEDQGGGQSLPMEEAAESDGYRKYLGPSIGPVSRGEALAGALTTEEAVNWFLNGKISLLELEHVYSEHNSVKAELFSELERRIRTFEHPDGTYRHWLLLSIKSESPDPTEALRELIAKRKGGK